MRSAPHKLRRQADKKRKGSKYKVEAVRWIAINIRSKGNLATLPRLSSFSAFSFLPPASPPQIFSINRHR